MYSHEFKVNDETFKISIRIEKKMIENIETDDWSIGVRLVKVDDGSLESTVSFKVEFQDTEIVRFTKKNIKKGRYLGWSNVLNAGHIDNLPDNTLNLFCTVTLHSKEKDILSTKRSRSGTNLIEEELASFKRRKVGLPSSKEKLFTDFIIESEDGMVIKCHRNFLASHSSVLRAMLESDMKEAKEKRLKMDFCGELLQNFVNFLYDTTLDDEIVVKLYEDFLHLSDMYDVGHLKLQTENILIKNLSTVSMINYYVLGDLYNAKNLKEAARTFIANNKDCFKDEEFTNQLQKIDPARIVEIMKIIM